ncbi:MAG: carboxyl transferase domain-containing protein, partial [Candidatus Thalassarchaeaceae archaeon]|nr:carboxyl transferase domain-containing protein [Candidatus Thalassarchaeaceae archaeon]
MGNDAEELAWRRTQASAGGGFARLEALRAAGRATARERIDSLLDPDSFIEIDALVSHRNRENSMHL